MDVDEVGQQVAAAFEDVVTQQLTRRSGFNA